MADPFNEFVAWLRGRGVDELTALLERRPESLSGRPLEDVTDLADRLSRPGPLLSALLHQPLPAWEVLTALAVLGGRADVGDLAALLEDSGDPKAHVAQVRAVIGLLSLDGLAWATPEDLALGAPGVVENFPEDHGLGLRFTALAEMLNADQVRSLARTWGLPLASTKAANVAALTERLRDPVQVRLRSAELGPAGQEVVATLAWGRELDLPANTYYAGMQQATQCGLLVGSGYGMGLQLPLEVALALRGPDYRLPFHPAAPPLVTTSVSPEMVEREGAVALAALDSAAVTLLDHIDRFPVPERRSGGIGAREVGKLAKATGVEQPMVRLVLELAITLQLLRPSPEGSWVCEPGIATWRDAEPALRVVPFLDLWTQLPCHPTQTHAGASALAVADPGRRCAGCLATKEAVVQEWLHVSDGAAATSESLADRTRWNARYPHLVHHDDPAVARGESGMPLGPVADEARLLGLVAHEAASPILRLLASGDVTGAIGLARKVLPEPIAKATFGSDLTAVVSGPPAAGVSRVLDGCADREGRGGAVTWRLSQQSVRRAFDAGETAESLTAALSNVSRGALPQPLTYLITDVSRRYGALVVEPAASVVHSHDQALLAQAAADRKLRRLGLRLVAPGTLTSREDLQSTVTALREAGYLPALGATESRPSGALKASGTGRRDQASSAEPGLDDFDTEVRALLRAGLPPMAVPREPEDPQEAAARLLAGVASTGPEGPDSPDGWSVASVTEERIRRASRRLSDGEVRDLAYAIDSGTDVLITYRASSGGVTTRLISDPVLIGDYLEAWCHLRSDSRTFLVGSIEGVEAV